MVKAYAVKLNSSHPQRKLEGGEGLPHSYSHMWWVAAVLREVEGGETKLIKA